MNVLLMTVRSDMGGGPKHVFDLGHALKEKGTNVFIASPLTEPFGKLFQKMASKFFELPDRFFNPISFISLIIFCKKNHIKVLHSHGRGAGVYSRLMKPFGFKVIHTYHGIHLDPGLKGKIKFLADKWLEGFTDQFIFVSQGELDRARSMGLTKKKNLNVINNGVPKTAFSKGKLSGKILGSLSRLTYQKGLDLLLNILKELPKGSPYKMIVAGSGEDEEALKNQVKQYQLENKVTFIGEVKNAELLFSKIDIYVSHARWEGLPLAVLEAMQAGIPCLLSEISAHKGFIDSGAAVSFHDADSFLKGLKSIEENAEKITDSALKYIEAHHGHNKQVEDTLKLYQL